MTVGTFHVVLGTGSGVQTWRMWTERLLLFSARLTCRRSLPPCSFACNSAVVLLLLAQEAVDRPGHLQLQPVHWKRHATEEESNP